jgi:putative Mn2+ efflux pump MntP
MSEFSWPVLVLAVILLLAGAVVGDALRAAAGGNAAQLGGVVMVAGSHP